MRLCLAEFAFQIQQRCRSADGIRIPAGNESVISVVFAQSLVQLFLRVADASENDL